MISRKMVFLLLFLFLPVNLGAKVEDKILKDNIKIKPGATYKLTINSKSPVNLGLFVDQESGCETACITIKQPNDASSYEYTTKSNAFSEYHPQSGKIEMNYTNISEKPVVISIHQYIHHCDAEACALLMKMGIKEPIDFASKNGKFKRLRIASIDTIKTSTDGSWSDVSGTTLFGDPFDVTFIWWLFDPKIEISCGKGRYIERYKKKISEGGGPVSIAGNLIYRNRPIFINVDTCLGRARSTPKNPDDF